MNQQSLPLIQEFNDWLTEQILTLSVDALSEEAVTCTACPKVMGDYIIEYQGEKLRMPAGQAYAFLQYVTKK
ncbi:MAG: hypothetical protein AAF289_08665 [Cyanobacteria bacterium P01_A01_bin.135]